MIIVVLTALPVLKNLEAPESGDLIPSESYKPNFYSMMRKSALWAFFLGSLLCLSNLSHSQPISTVPEIRSDKDPKPYKVLTVGKQVTIRSEKTIKNVMLWTASGHRILEQKEVNALQFTFNITVSEKIFFVMVMLDNGKLYTEKIGVR